MSIVDTIKARPMLFGGVVVGGVLIVVALRMSSASQVATTGVAYGSDVGTGDALQSMQLQINRDIAIAGIQAQAGADANAAALEAAKLDYDYKTDALETERTINLATINATLQALTTRDTLSAQTEQKNIQANVDIAGITTGAQIEQQRILADALVKQAKQQANVAQSAIAAQPKQSLWSKIFG